MKRLLLSILIVALVLVLIGCDLQNMTQSTIESTLAGNRATYIIEVSGTEGLNFTGRYVVMDADYDPVDYVAFSSESYDVSGNVSQEYMAPDVLAVEGMFQKLSAGNETLEVNIWRGAVGTGTLVDSASTTNSHGAVLVTAIKEG
ncbi:MAG: hypothetical protein KAQ73_01540 [Dehalococcoidia bacterium]|nr:hypothetical protein [Dehalococcoidia bacterium]